MAKYSATIVNTAVMATGRYRSFTFTDSFNKSKILEVSVIGLNLAVFGLILINNNITNVTTDKINPPNVPFAKELDNKMSAIKKQPNNHRQNIENTKFGTAASPNK